MTINLPESPVFLVNHFNTVRARMPFGGQLLNSVEKVVMKKHGITAASEFDPIIFPMTTKRA